MPEDNNNWLQNLQPGDSVIVSPGATYTPDYLVTVTRTTQTQIHVGHSKFRRMDGRQMREHKARLLNKFRETRWGRLPLSVLEEIERIVDEHMPKERKSNA